MVLTWHDVGSRATNISEVLTRYNHRPRVYGVPRGGTFAAMAVQAAYRSLVLVEDPEEADVFIDDVLDSGATFAHYRREYGDKPFLVLVNKHEESIVSWVEFPWDRLHNDNGPQENIRRILQYIGDDPKREGLLETPDRVVRSYAELFSGYKQNPEDVFKTFEDGACDEMVVLRNIELISHCEHHMIPFIGEAHIAYIPNGKVIGVSKLARLLEIYARRLQIQERLTQQITKALDDHLKPLGSACIIKAKHLCLCARGVGKQHSEMITSSMTGVFRDNTAARQELLSLIHG